jgi:hypothetical protein
LRIIDISNPASPFELGSLDGVSAFGMVLKGNYLYAAASSNGFYIIDVTDPAHPVKNGTVAWGGFTFTLAQIGEFLYVPTYHKGLGIFNISDPVNPLVAGSYDIGNALGVTCANDLVYVTENEVGLFIFRNNLQTGTNNELALVNPDIHLEINFPNPFSTVTNISYTLQAGNFVKLAVFDLTGHEVKSLVNKHQPSGSYSVTFDAGDLPEGIYVYRLQSGRSEQSLKMVLLR